MANTRKTKRAVQLCMIPGCGRPARSRALCARHLADSRKGFSLEQMVQRQATGPRRAPPGISKESPFPVRISQEARARLKKEAPKKGYGSAYRLGGAILEAWPEEI